MNVQADRLNFKKEYQMTVPPKPTNADQDPPKRQGDDFPAVPEQPSSPDHERNAPIPEEETYEREPGDQRRSPGIE
jgi:hypothetical protein